MEALELHFGDDVNQLGPHGDEILSAFTVAERGEIRRRILWHAHEEGRWQRRASGFPEASAA